MGDTEASSGSSNKSDVKIEIDSVLHNKRVAFKSMRSVSSHSLLSARQLVSESDISADKGVPSALNKCDSGVFESAGDRRNVALLEHLHRHASSLGLQTPSLYANETSDHNHSTIIDMHMAEKPHQVQNSASLSWKKLQMLKPKLKTASSTSALMAGFAMAAVVEVQLSTQQVGHLPAPLLVSFALCTSLLVAVHMLVLLISTCILPSMEGISNLHSINLVNESPHERLQRYIEFAWICSTVLGIVLFMLEVTIVCWVQFYNVLTSAAYVATAVFIAFICVFVWFAVIFYRIVATNTYENRLSDIQHLEKMRSHIDLDQQTTIR